MSTFELSGITSDLLDEMRLQADPLADEVVARIISAGEEKHVNEIMKMLFKNDAFHPGMFASLGPEVSGVLDDYIRVSGQLPSWADQKKIKAGERLFSLYGPEIFMLLNMSSLPLCYTCAKGSQVLFDTGRLLTHGGDVDPLARRSMETAQMVVNVLAEGGLSSEGRGVVTIQKVRLIHASIRYYLKRGDYQGNVWDVPYYGEPINQEDLAGTLMSFAPVIINGLNKLNISLSVREMTDYMHFWKVVGHLMGIDHRLLPNTYEEGFGLATAIMKHQACPSEAGKALTSSCVQFINYLVPGNSLDDVPNFFIHYFLEDFSRSSGVDLAACIGVPERTHKKDKIILMLSRLITGELGHLEEHKLVQVIGSYINRKLLDGIIHHFNHGKEVQFFIPPSLQRDWGLVDEWEDRWRTTGFLGSRIALQKRKDAYTSS